MGSELASGTTKADLEEWRRLSGLAPLALCALRPYSQSLPGAPGLTAQATVLLTKAFDLRRGRAGKRPNGACHWFFLGLRSFTALPFKGATAALQA